jgi:hypothetical protein
VVADRKRLSEYEHKRDRRRTPEPFGGQQRRRSRKAKSQPESVLSGRTIEQVAAEADE